MANALRRLYDWTLGLAAHKNATAGLAGISFIESSFFPIPPDVILVPMSVARRDKAFYYATVCTISSVLGGFLGYAIGYFLYETVGLKIIQFYGADGNFAELKAKYDEWGGWIILAKGMTPIPYKILTILSGVMQQNLLIFTMASIGARAMRFYMLAFLIWKYGAPIQAFIEKNLTLVTIAFFALLIGGIYAIKYII